MAAFFGRDAIGTGGAFIALVTPLHSEPVGISIMTFFTGRLTGSGGVGRVVTVLALGVGDTT